MNNQKVSRPRRSIGCCSGCAMLLLLSICLTVAGVAMSYFVAGGIMHRQLLERYPPPGKMVDVGGYNLHLYCLGQGSPTLVVDVQWSDSTPNWWNVQSRLSRTNRTCLFDRAGHAWSNPSPRPREIQVMAEEMHTTLTNAGITSDYILLSEGEASLYARYYAGQHTKELRGLVLVTPVLVEPGEWAGFDRVNHLTWVMTTPFDVLTWLTSSGQKFSALVHKCDPSYPPEICNLDNIWTYDIQDQRTVSAELNLWVMNNAVVDNATINLGDLPLVVIYPKKFYGEESTKKLNALFTLSTQSTALPQDEFYYRDRTPGVIVEAVRSLLR